MAPEPDLTRAKVIDAAGEVFADRGFQNATIREICQRAGANVAAVNYYFRDKLGLYTEVLEKSVLCGQGEAVDEALAETHTPEEALRKLVYNMLWHMCGGGRPAWSSRIMAHELAQPTSALAHVIDKVMRPRYTRLRAIVASIVHLPPDHETTRLCAHSVIGQVVHFAHGRPVIAVLWPNLNLTKAKDLEMVANHVSDFTLRNLHALARQNRKEKVS